MPRPRALRQAGVTLAEMLVVTAVLALAARIAIPNANPLANAGNDVATAEVLHAIRFAQREAVRMGAWHTVRIDPSTQSLRVYRLTDAGAEDTNLPVLHPIDKRPYNVTFGNGQVRAAIALVDFDYEGAANLTTLSFRPDGTPALRVGARDGDVRVLQKGQVNIRYANVQRILVVDTLTGRVSG
jgi:prepilin-type N-terminal cleavage/methylation domain-containing protein